MLAAGIGGGLYAIGSGAPFATIRAALNQLVSPQKAAGLALFVTLCIFMGVFSSIKTMLPDVVPFLRRPALADLDAFLHGQDPWRYFVAWLAPELTRVIESMYFGIWGVLLPGSMLAVLLLRQLEPVRTQYVWTMLVVWPLLGNVIAAMAMSAGPVYYQLVTGDARFAGLVDYVARHSAAQHWGRVYLWQSYVTGSSGAGSGISAFPSLHVANATLLALLAGRVNRWLFGAACAFCGVIFIGSVHLGWHYAVDGYFSIAATTLIWLGVGRLLRRRRSCRCRHSPDRSVKHAMPAGSCCTDMAVEHSCARPPRSASGRCCATRSIRKRGRVFVSM